MSHRMLQYISAVVLSCAPLVGCVKKITEQILPRDSDPTTEADGHSPANDSQKLRAEKLVTYAESLLTPIGFFYADEILDEALKVDPSNRQAQFYKAYLAPYMKLRGLLNRINYDSHPAAGKVGRQFFAAYERAQGGLKEFLNQPAKPIRSERDLQDLLTEIFIEQTKLVDFIKKNKSFLTHFSMPLFVHYDDVIRDCSVEKIGKGNYKLSPCMMTRYKAPMNQGDWEYLAQMWTASKIAILIANSYDLTGYFDMEMSLKDASRSNKRTIGFLRKLANGFGALRGDHKLSEVMGMASDVYGGFTWLISMREQMCDEPKRQRHLFNSSSTCVPATIWLFDKKAQTNTDQALQLLNMSLTGIGGSLQLLKPMPGHVTGKATAATNIDILSLIKNPVPNIKSLFPNRYDKCGAARGFADETFGGTFRDGNASDLMLRKTRSKCAVRRK